MKKNQILIGLLLLLTSMAAQGQQSIMGYVNTTANLNSIIRPWNDKLVLYAENGSGQGYFMLATSLTQGATVVTATVPQNIHVHDFRVFEEQVFFVGDTIAQDTTAITGKFDINDLFYNSGMMYWDSIPNFYSSDEALRYRQISLKRLAVYRYGSDVHLFAVGNIATTYQNTTTYETGIFDILDGSYTYKFTLGSGIHSEGVFFDIANTDKYLVTVAHKGPRTDLSVNGYLLMRPFYKDSDPLASTSGSNLYNSDGYTVALDNIRAAHASKDTFDIAYTVYTLPNYQEMEVAHFYVNDSGIVRSTCYAQSTMSLTSTHQHNQFDMTHIEGSDVAAIVGDCNPTFRHQADLVQFRPGCTPVGEELYLSDLKMNSVCTKSPLTAAISGNYPLGLGIFVQQLPIGQTCGNASSMTLSSEQRVDKNTVVPCLVRGEGFVRRCFQPTISSSVFKVTCEK